MTVRISVGEPEESDWSRFFSVPSNELLGLDGLWDASAYQLGVVLDIELNGQCITPVKLQPLYESFLILAIGWMAFADNIERYGEATWYENFAQPVTFEITLMENSLEIRSFTRGSTVDTVAECMISEFRAETLRVSQSALAVLRARMREKGLEHILDEWLTLSAQLNR